MHNYKRTVEILLEEISAEQSFQKFSNAPPLLLPLLEHQRNTIIELDRCIFLR